MLTRQRLIGLIALGTFSASAGAGSLVYVVNGNQFGTVDLASGAFQQIGPNTPELVGGLAQGSNGSLLTLTFSGKLDSINRSTGAITTIGATGLANCQMTSSQCAANSANTLGQMGGTTYATDFANNLYTVDPSTGRTTLVGRTGMPAVTFVPDTPLPNGTFDGFDEALFSARGKLYATFDAININPDPFTVVPLIAPELYQIDPSTGHATVVGPTTLTLDAAVDVNGTTYAFEDMTSQIDTLDLANGNTKLITNFDPVAGIIDGAVAPTPEPASVALLGFGLATASFFSCKRWMRKKQEC